MPSASKGRTGIIFLLAVLLIMVGFLASGSEIVSQGMEPRPEKLDGLLSSLVAAPAEIGGEYLAQGAESEFAYQPLSRDPGTGISLKAFGPLYSEETSSVRALIKTDGSVDGIEEMGITIQSVVGPVAAASIPLDSLLPLTALPNVEIVQGVRRYSLTNDISVPATGATGFHNVGIDGSGVIVAVIDTGVDFTHDDFRNEDGTTRIKFICDQTDSPGVGDNTCPGGGTANGGTLWDEDDINDALDGLGTVSQEDTNGHGTHVLGTAAGDDETYGGMAPGADLIVVKSDLATDDIISAVSFIDDKAAELDQPYVINMSFGGHIGPHDGTDLMSEAIDSITGPGKEGKAIVVAAGNEGNDTIHARGDVSQDTQSVDFTIPSGTSDVIIDIWYDGSDGFSFNFVAPNGQSFVSPIPPGGIESGCGTGFCIIAIHTTTQSNNNSKQIIFEVTPDAGSTIGLNGTYSFTLSGVVVNEGEFDAWIGDCSPTVACEFTSSHGDSNRTVGEPAVARNAITVGSYNTKDCWEGQSGQLCVSPLPVIGDISAFSSIGPTRDGRSKPDIAAPGQMIVSTLAQGSSLVSSAASDGEHAAIRGTSMAAPHVTGAVALLLAEDQTLDAAEIKAKLQNEAVKDGFTGSSCNNTWGCGKLSITPLNIAPVANDDTASISETSSITIEVLANDTDVEGDDLTITSVSQGSNGSVVNNGDDVTYTMDGGFSTSDSFTYTISDGDGGSDTASVSVTFDPTLLISKSATSSPVLVGDAVAFTFEVTNTGLSTSTGVIITDALPQNLNFDSASAGCSHDTGSHAVTCNLGDLGAGVNASSTVVVIPTAIGGITNSATVTSDTPVPGAIHGTDGASITVNPALLITKDAAPSTVLVGEPVTFSLEVTNTGLSTSTGVTVTDALPQGLDFQSSPDCGYDSGSHTVTCNLGVMGAGASASSTVVVIPTAAGSITNEATVTSDTPLPGTVHGTDDASIQVNSPVSSSGSGGGGGGGGGASVRPVIDFQPVEAIVFNAVKGGEAPEPQILTIWTSKNRSTLRFDVAVSVTWLRLDRVEGISDDPGDRERIELSVNIAGLDAGTYEGKVIISANRATNDPQEVAVRLVIEEPMPATPSELAEFAETNTLEDVMEVIRDKPVDTVVDTVEQLSVERAAEVLAGMDSARAGTVLAEITEERFTEILEASGVNELARPLSEMPVEEFNALLEQAQVRDSLLRKLTEVSAVQLFPASIPEADPGLPLPVATQDSPGITTYTVPEASETGWTTIVGSPEPIEKILARFTSRLSDIRVKVEVLDQVPAGIPELLPGQMASAVFSVNIENAAPEDISVAHLTLSVEKAWLQANGIHRWSMRINRFDEQFGAWVASPAKLIGEDEDKVFYTAVVPGFSVFALAGSTELSAPVFELSGLEIIPVSPVEGQALRVGATVQNTGSADAIYPASLWIDNEVEDSELVPMGAGESAQVSFTFSKPVGTHAVRIDRLTCDFNVRPRVRLLDEPLPTATAASVPSPTAIPTPAPTVAPVTPSAGLQAPTTTPVLPSPTAVAALAETVSPTPAPIATTRPVQAAPVGTLQATPDAEDAMTPPESEGGIGLPAIFGMVIAVVGVGVVFLLSVRRRKPL